MYKYYWFSLKSSRQSRTPPPQLTVGGLFFLYGVYIFRV